MGKEICGTKKAEMMASSPDSFSKLTSMLRTPCLLPHDPLSRV